MSVRSGRPKAFLKNHDFWPVAVLISFAALHLIVTWRIGGDMDRLTAIFWETGQETGQSRLLENLLSAGAT